MEGKTEKDLSQVFLPIYEKLTFLDIVIAKTVVAISNHLSPKSLNSFYSYFIGFKCLKERCMHVIVSALLEQKTKDPHELCSRLPDFVPTVARHTILDAFWSEWNRPSPSSSCSMSPSPSPCKKICTS